MRICVSGPQCSGKSTFIKDFLKAFPMYTTPTKTYRDLVKSDKLKINQEGDAESQVKILNFQVDTVQQYDKNDNVIFDRSVIDPLAYSLWMYEKGNKGIDDNHIEYMIKIVKEAIKLYDIVFMVPITKFSPIKLEKDDLRDTDETFRDEMNNIFNAIQESYYKQSHVIFPNENCPATIDLIGNREERIALAKMYIAPDGKPFGEENNLVNEILDQELGKSVNNKRSSKKYE